LVERHPALVAFGHGSQIHQQKSAKFPNKNQPNSPTKIGQIPQQKPAKFTNKNRPNSPTKISQITQ